MSVTALGIGPVVLEAGLARVVADFVPIVADSLVAVGNVFLAVLGMRITILDFDVMPLSDPVSLGAVPIVFGNITTLPNIFPVLSTKFHIRRGYRPSCVRRPVNLVLRLVLNQPLCLPSQKLANAYTAANSDSAKSLADLSLHFEPDSDGAWTPVLASILI